MGRLWNAKPCRCRKCRKKCPTITSGIAHVYVKHGVPFSRVRDRTRDYLEEITTWNKMGRLRCPNPKCRAALAVVGSDDDQIALSYRGKRTVLPRNKSLKWKAPCPKCGAKLSVSGSLGTGLLTACYTFDNKRRSK